MKTNTPAIYGTWRTAWQSKPYKVSTITGVALVAGILACLANFFPWVEAREGAVLNDRLLAAVPAVNVSYPLLFFIWTAAIVGIYRATKDPDMFLRFTYGYFILTASRIITMTLMPLNPPAGLIDITDPLSNVLYGSKFITKDLFYSGHTGTLLLIYLNLKKQPERYYVLLCTFCVGALVLVQHVHYVIDVFSAPFFTYCCYLLSLKITDPILRPADKTHHSVPENI